MSIVQHVRRPFRRRGKPGSAPGVVHDDPQSPPPRIHVIAYGPDSCEESDLESVDEIEDWLDKHPVTWVNVDGLGNAALIEQLGDRFDIHKLVREDIVHVHQRAKVEDFFNHLFIVARMVTMNDRLVNEQVSMIVREGLVLTFQEFPGDCLDLVRQRIREHHGRIRESGSDYLAYALLDAILDGYFPVLEAYGERLNEIEDELTYRASAQAITEIHRIRSDLYLLSRSIWSHRDAVNVLMRETTSLIENETRVYLRDCFDHVIQITDVTEMCRAITSDLRDYHFSQISTRQNEVMKVLTIMATVFIPLSFVAGLYGMNFDPARSPWNMPELKWFYGYPFALGLMASIATVLMGYFWYRGWLGRDATWIRLGERQRRRPRRNVQADR